MPSTTIRKINPNNTVYVERYSWGGNSDHLEIWIECQFCKEMLFDNEYGFEVSDDDEWIHVNGYCVCIPPEDESAYISEQEWEEAERYREPDYADMYANRFDEERALNAMENRYERFGGA